MKRFISHKERCEKTKYDFLKNNPEEWDNKNLDLKIKEIVNKNEIKEDLAYNLSELEINMIPVDLYELNFKDGKEEIDLNFGKNETHFYIISFYSKNLIITEEEIKIVSAKFSNKENKLENIIKIGKRIEL